MTKLLYQGHGSYRIITASKTVVYVDPFAGEGYNIPADLVLVTHEHSDHNQISLITQKPSCRIITEREALCDGVYQKFTVDDISIQAVPASNRNHPVTECVGYVLNFDGISLYAAGDTSETEAMSNLLPSLHLDYALLPIDGIYNMDAKEASHCAELIGAKYTIPIHMKPGSLFDRKMAEKFSAKGRLIVVAGDEILLK